MTIAPRDPDPPHAAATAPRPVAPGVRLFALDVLRGFALLGILVMNLPSFGASFFVEADGSFLWTQAMDRWATQVRDVLFSGKANSLFSLLFGIGFTIQYAHMRQRHAVHADAMYLRRLAVLFLIGALHMALLWPGDVLHTYALLGVLLFALRHASDRILGVLIVCCLLFTVLFGAVRLKLITPGVVAEAVTSAKAMEASANLAYGHGSYLDAVRENVRVMTYIYTHDIWHVWSELRWFTQLLLTMLLGMLVGRRRWMERLPELMPQMRRLTWLTLAVGLVCALISELIFQAHRAPGPSAIKLLGSACYWTARPLLMCCYALIIVRLALQVRWARLLGPMAAAGRMPLTNYLMQSVICVTLFHAWGFGLWLKVGPAAMLALAPLIFFGVQVPLSQWWLKRHDPGAGRGAVGPHDLRQPPAGARALIANGAPLAVS